MEKSAVSRISLFFKDNQNLGSGFYSLFQYLIFGFTDWMSFVLLNHAQKLDSYLSMTVFSESSAWFTKLKNLKPIYLFPMFKLWFLTLDFWFFYQIKLWRFFHFDIFIIFIISNPSFLLCIYRFRISAMFNEYPTAFDNLLSLSFCLFVK